VYVLALYVAGFFQTLTESGLNGSGLSG